jgi:hypothetical protein
MKARLSRRPIRRLAPLSLLMALTACVPAAPLAPPESTPAPASPASAAPEATATPDRAAMVMEGAGPTMVETFPSPDGAITAEVTVYDCVTTETGETLAYDTLELIDLRGDRTLAASQLQYCGGLGAHGLQGLFWSPNERYFYFTDARTGVPDGGCGPWPGSMARVDVQIGGAEALGGAIVSPDGLSIASWIGDDLVLWSIDEAEADRIPAAVPGAAHGPIAWAPDGQALAYVLTAESCPPWGMTTVVVHRRDKAESQVLVESDAPSFVQAEWTEAGSLRLFDAAGLAWNYDLAADRLTRPP